MNPLAQERRAPGLLRFALPTVVMMVCMGLYTVTDTVLVSQLVGTDALASVNIATPVSNVAVGIATMLAAGGSAVIARDMGAGEHRRASARFTQIVLFGGCLGLLLAAAGLLCFPQILRFLGASGRLWAGCKAYLGTLLLFLPATFLQTLFASFFVAAGRPGLGSALSIGAGVLNLVLDVVFMKYCGLGVRGAALGTGLGQMVPALAGLWFFSRRKQAPAFCRPSRAPDVLMKSCSNGASELVGQLAAAVTTCLLNRAMLSLRGADGVAALTILIYAQFLFSTACLGFSMGVSPIISFQLGEGNPARVRRTVLDCLELVAGVSAAGFLAAWCGSAGLTAFFAAPGSAVYLLAVEGFRIFSVSFLFCGVNLFTSALFTALSDGKISALLSFLRTFCFLTAGILLLPRVLGVAGLWLAVPLAEAAAFAVSGCCLARLARKLRAA